MTRRRTLAAGLLVAGLLLVTGAPAAWLLLGRDPSYGDPDAPAPVAPRTETTPAAVAPPTEAAGAEPAPPARGPATRPARLADLAAGAEPAPEPVRVRIPALGIDAPVDPTGVVAGTGEMEIPGDARRVGWYRHGPPPGATAGATVLAGHVDSAAQGPGAFFRLADVPEGAEIVVERADGSAETYVARTKQSYDKEVLPAAELFARDGPHRLVLITCGGEFDRSRGHYLRNVVVVAETAGG